MLPCSLVFSLGQEASYKTTLLKRLKTMKNETGGGMIAIVTLRSAYKIKVRDGCFLNLFFVCFIFLTHIKCRSV